MAPSTSATGEAFSKKKKVNEACLSAEAITDMTVDAENQYETTSRPIDKGQT